MSFRRPKHIKDIYCLRPAQHVYVHKRRFDLVHYEHHGIIMSVDPEGRTFDMLHYVKPSLFKPITLIRGKIDFIKYSRKGIFLMQYEDGECLEDEEVLRRAKSCIGRQDFNLFRRTSENMARYCKMGWEQEPENKEERVVRYENFTGVLYDHPRDKVTSIKQLAAGDHLVFLRYKIAYEHHAIIIYISESENQMTLVHFQKRSNKIQVIEETVEFKKEIIPFRVYYNDEEALCPEEVVSTAKGLVTMGGYHIFKNNCEHLAFLCKTSACLSEQVNSAITWAVVSGMNLGNSALRGTVAIADDLFTALARGALKYLKRGAISISVLIELAIAAWGILQANKLYEKGKISLKVFRAKVATLLATASLGLAGTVAGSVVGGCAAGPPGAIAGAIIGGVLGGQIPQGICNVVNGVAQNTINEGVTTDRNSESRDTEEILFLKEYVIVSSEDLKDNQDKSFESELLSLPIGSEQLTQTVRGLMC